MKVGQHKLTTLWQTGLAVPLAFIVWMLGILIGSGLFAFYSGAPLIPSNDFSKVLFLSVAAWIGVWAAYHVCEWFFSTYSRWSIFIMLAAVAAINVIAEIGHPIFWDVIARGAQGIVTSLTAYVFFCYEANRR